MGNNIITDFEIGIDKLDFTAFKFAEASDIELKQMMTAALSFDVNGDAVLDLSELTGHGTLTLNNVHFDSGFGWDDILL